ncbi:Charged multivesicular body protein 6 [Symbiodinium microadriaticum]|uniref:Charged multivesicular body protein 6 n=1 Tax=Symbiodinium microadriaticum TaxID=2951 RepID=A0A1Q9EXS3_SYMMI|nr:Charged multivesicular body protein 6 [Symbiodinium microadriaticum]
MGQLFGKKPPQGGPPPGVDDADMALLDLKSQRDQLLAQRRRVEARADKAHDVARTLVASGKKHEAMLALRRREQQKQLATDCQGHLARLEELICSLEMAQTTKGTVEALKTGVAMMKRIQKDIGGVDQVQRLLGEHEDVMDAQQEIQAMLSAQGSSAEDPEMLKEFERLQEEAALDKLQSASEVPASQEPSAQVAEPKVEPRREPMPAQAEPVEVERPREACSFGVAAISCCSGGCNSRACACMRQARLPVRCEAVSAKTTRPSRCSKGCVFVTLVILRASADVRCPTEKDAKASGVAVAVPQKGSAHFDRVGSSNATVVASWHLARLPVFATTPALGRLCVPDNATALQAGADAQLRQLASTLHRDAATIATAACVAGAAAGCLPFLAVFLGARTAYSLLLLAALLGWPGLTLHLFWRHQLLRNDPFVLDFNSLEPWLCGAAAILSGAMAAVVMLGLIRLRKSLWLGFICIAAAADELRALWPAFAVLGGCAMAASFFALLVGLWTLEFLASHAAVEWAPYPLLNSSGHALTTENLGSFAQDDLPEVFAFSPELRFRWPAWLSVLLGFLSLCFWEAWLSCLHQLQVAALVFLLLHKFYEGEV